jgi:hypothetical protein
MTDLHTKRLTIALVIGLFSIGLGVVETFSGDSLQGYGRTASRGEDPKAFWRAVAVHFLAGLTCLGYYLYKTFLTN